MRHWVLMLALWLAASLAPLQAAPKPVVVMQMDGMIAQPNMDYLSRALNYARGIDAEALVIELNTPGGLMDAMQQMVSAILSSDVPVIVYVSPQGAKAASAGVFILLASHVAAMAPGTVVGAAHPVDSSGGDIGGDMRAKVTNFAASYIRAIARQRGRDEAWAERAVRSSVAQDEREALKNQTIDLIARNTDELLALSHGRTVTVNNKSVVLQTKGAEQRPFRRSPVENFLLLLVNPNVLVILGAIALAGLVAEVQNPGAIFPGAIGALALVMVLYGASALPLSSLGVALVVIAIVLFVLELVTTGHGLLAVTGVISLLFGLMLMVDSQDPALRVSIVTALLVALGTGAFFLVAVAAGLKAQRSRQASGAESLIGKEAAVKATLAPKGQVFVDGCYWNAITEGDSVPVGETVLVTGIQGLTLVVKRKEQNP